MTELAGPDLRDGLSPEAVRAELGKILATDTFRRSERSRKLLEAVVEQTLAGKSERLKEYTLAVEVFGRKPTFDPHLDPIVRVEAGRLRAKLKHYYEHQGKHEPFHIEVPLRSYSAVFRPQVERRPEAASEPRVSLGQSKWILIFALL